MELLVFRKCFSVYVCMCVCGTRDCFFPFTYWFWYLFICIYLYIHSIICRMRFVLKQFAFFQWIAFVYTCVRHSISKCGILYAQINGKTHTQSPHNYSVSHIPTFIHSFAISLIYYAQQIVYGHFGWLKTMSHNCPQRDRICVYFVSMNGFITFSLVVMFGALFFASKELTVSCSPGVQSSCLYVESTKITSWLISVDAINECHTHLRARNWTLNLINWFHCVIFLIPRQMIIDATVFCWLRAVCWFFFLSRARFFSNRKLNSSQNNAFASINQKLVSKLLFCEWIGGIHHSLYHSPAL